MAVLLVCQSLELSLEEVIEKSYSFLALPHRLEFVEEVNGVRFYNDSIATIPQASIKAMESVNGIATIILGGYDRGIDYQILIDYLLKKESINVLLLGDVGDRIKKGLEASGFKGFMLLIEDFDKVVAEGLRITPVGRACLFSPAAASYDVFKNFEERGQRFIDLVKEIN